MCSDRVAPAGCSSGVSAQQNETRLKQRQREMELSGGEHSAAATKGRVKRAVFTFDEVLWMPSRTRHEAGARASAVSANTQKHGGAGHGVKAVGWSESKRACCPRIVVMGIERNVVILR